MKLSASQDSLGLIMKVNCSIIGNCSSWEIENDRVSRDNTRSGAATCLLESRMHKWWRGDLA